MSATATAAMFYAIGLVAVCGVVGASHWMMTISLKALSESMSALASAIEALNKR